MKTRLNTHLLLRFVFILGIGVTGCEKPGDPDPFSAPENTHDAPEIVSWVNPEPSSKPVASKLESITFPSLEFSDTPFLDAMHFIQSKSIELDFEEQDPRKKGVILVCSPDLSQGMMNTPITLQLVNVPMKEVIHYTIQLAGANIKIEEHALIVMPTNPGDLRPETDANPDKVAFIENKLNVIVVPSLEFTETPFAEAIQFFRRHSYQWDTTEDDPNKRGINIVVQSSPSPDTKIDLKLSNVPLGEALRYTTALANMKYKVEPHAVVIGSKEEQ